MSGHAPISTSYAGLRCRCPACGKGKLYRNLLDINDACPQCGQNLKDYQQGDGPASLSILLVGAVVGIAAAVVEVKYEPPLWVHAALWIPLIAVGSVLSLRIIKAWLVAFQYRYGGKKDVP